MSDPVTPLTPAELQKQKLNALHESWFHKSAVAFDDLVNVFAGGNPDETISSRMARWATEETGFKKNFGTAVCRALNIVSRDHGAKAEVDDYARAESVMKIEAKTPTMKAEQ